MTHLHIFTPRDIHIHLCTSIAAIGGQAVVRHQHIYIHKPNTKENPHQKSNWPTLKSKSNFSFLDSRVTFFFYKIERERFFFFLLFFFVNWASRLSGTFSSQAICQLKSKSIWDVGVWRKKIDRSFWNKPEWSKTTNCGYVSKTPFPLKFRFTFLLLHLVALAFDLQI